MGRMPGFLDFTKPGNDRVDDMRYPPFIRFWRRYGRNITKMIAVNLVYAIPTLPVYVWLVSLLNVASAEAGGTFITVLGSLLLYEAIGWPAVLQILPVVLSILLLGPMTAAMTGAVLNCAWDRPSMFWSRFRESFRENWKQALPIGLLDVLFLFVTVYYMVDARAVFGGFGGILRVLWLLVGLFYALGRVYVYPIMVTIRLPLGGLLKNSLILALLKIWRPLLAVLTAGLLALLCLGFDLVLIPCFVYSFVAFTAAFLTEPVIDRYLIHPETNEENP